MTEALMDVLIEMEIDVVQVSVDATTNETFQKVQGLESSKNTSNNITLEFIHDEIDKLSNRIREKSKNHAYRCS